VHLGFDESPVITAHCHITQHYTRTRQLYQPWCAPIGSKRARIEELRRQNESEAKLAECARTAVITRARSLAERARIFKEEKAICPAVVIDVVMSVAPILVVPSSVVPSAAVLCCAVSCCAPTSTLGAYCYDT